MKKTAKAAQSGARRKARTRSRIVTWSIVAGVVGALGYFIATSSGVAYDEDDIAAVRFDMLDAGQKKTALVAANAARCTCGCNMTLAQCVATDTTCPVRDGNIERIKTMVREAAASKS
jgi:hypothetical protein